VKRWAALAAVFAVVTAGVVVGVLTRADGSAAQPSSLRGVLAQVRKSFGDSRLVRANIGRSGAALQVVVAAAGDGTKSTFEAILLADVVADWMRSRGQEAIKRVFIWKVFHSRLPRKRYVGWFAASTPASPSLSLDTCKSAAQTSVIGNEPPITHTSVQWLPYLHGACVFHLRIRAKYPLDASGYPGRESILSLGNDMYHGIYAEIARKIGPLDNPIFVEMNDAHERRLYEAADGPATGWVWLRPGLPD
jgi:hypothetical protein